MMSIIEQLKERIGGELTGRLGLNKAQADGAVEEANSSMEEVMTRDPSALMELLSQGNATGAKGLLGDVEGNYLGRLTGKLGLDAGRAAQVKDLVLPALFSLVQEQGASMLGSVLGGSAGLPGDLAWKLGGLGKMFGK
jgi:hypothetical protein